MMGLSLTSKCSTTICLLCNCKLSSPNRPSKYSHQPYTRLLDSPSGAYEFLPIEIEGEGSLQAILSLKVSLGVQVDTGGFWDASFSTGIDSDVFAYVADFLVQVNGSSSAADNGDCDLSAVAEYTLAVGAAAGATVAVDTYSWGPSPETTVPIWYTTLASMCAGAKTSSTASSAQITSSAEINQRDTTPSTTISTTSSSYTIVNCISSGLINCPVNAQNTTSYVGTTTAVLTVQSGSTEAFPTNTFTSVTTDIPFGTKVHKLAATSGSPTSYVPTTSSTASSGSNGGGSTTNNHSNGNRDKLIIGLSVGLGVPFLAGLIIAFG